MGFLVVVGLGLLAAGFFVGFAVGDGFTKSGKARAKELNRARRTLALLDEIIAGGSLELSMLGSNVGDHALDVLRKYWRGDHK